MTRAGRPASRHRARRTRAFAWVLCAGLGACSAGPETGSAGLPAAPGNLLASAGDGAVALSWEPVPDAAGYRLYWSASPGVSPASGTRIDDVGSPYTHRGLDNGRTYHYVVVAHNGAGQGPASSEASATPSAASALFDPPWASVAPSRVLSLTFDGTQSREQNGAILRQRVAALRPGDRLELGDGVWSVDGYWSIDLAGTETAPIRIAAAAGARPIVTRPDANQNTVNIGARADTGYVSIEGIEITGGDTAVKLYRCAWLRIDRCHIHHCAGVGIAANSANTEFLWLTRNEIHHTDDTAEGMYLGANNAVWVMRHSVIAQNHVHHTYGSQGDGIEIKQGSWGNWIVENLVHDCRYPCIIAYGTGGNPVNLIERNVCYASGDNAIQVQGEAIVRNNLILNGRVGFASHDHQGQTRDLTFVHNTIVTAGRGADLASWSGRPGMVFANNVVYSRDSEAVWFGGGSAGVLLTGNVALGAVAGAGFGFVPGRGLQDFVDVSWDAARRDAEPSPGSALRDAGDALFAVPEDLRGVARGVPPDAGCYEGS